MSDVKAIVLDLDGTLLTDEKTIGEYTVKVLKGLKDTKIILASARQYIRILPYIQSLDLVNENNYTICLNGAIVVNNKEKILNDEPMDKEDVKAIHQLKTEENLVWTYYTYDKKPKLTTIADFDDFIEHNPIYKIVCEASKEIIDKVRPTLNPEFTEKFEVTSSEPTRIEFVKKGMTKLGALKSLLKMLQIDSENVIAIGDGENDISIISNVGYGVAMANSNDTVKSKAKYVTLEDNNHDGVGHIIETIIKK